MRKLQIKTDGDYAGTYTNQTILNSFSIKEFEKGRLDDFIAYLTIHLSENGENGSVLFQPISRYQSTFSEDWKEKFKEGIKKNNGDIGWRKVWIALNDDKIIGHIDIRSHMQINTEHRVILGMGIRSNYRNLKIGQKLLEHLIDYCLKNNKISWIDLQVLTSNTVAISLYKKMNFKELSNTRDMFRIGNISYDYTSMTLNVEN